MTKKILFTLIALFLAGCSAKNIPVKRDTQKETVEENRSEKVEKAKVNNIHVVDWRLTETKTIPIAIVHRMHKIAQKGDTEAAQKYIDDGGDITVASTNGNTFLHEATKFGHLKMARLLIENGADVNAISIQNGVVWSPLKIAVLDRYYDIATLLIEKGADINFKEQDNSNFLHRLAWDGDVRMARILLEGGIDVNAENNHGATALRIGVQENHLEFVQTIFETGEVDTNVPSNNVSLLLQMANQFGYENMVTFLSKQESI